jgi:peptide chain release factor 3
MELNVRTKISLHKACWVKPMMQRIMNSKNLNELNKVSSKDKYGQLVFLADSDFTIQMTKINIQV